MAKEAIDLFRELAKQPDLRKGRLVDVTDSIVTVESYWSQRCLEKKVCGKFMRNYTLNANDLSAIHKSRPLMTDDSFWTVHSPSGNRIAIVRRHTPENSKSTKKNDYIEIWSKSGRCEKVFNVSSCEKHGAVYDADDDDTFGALSWSFCENKIAYVAEKKLDIAEAYFEAGEKPNDNEPLFSKHRFLYKEDWGETFVDKVQPVVCTLDLNSGEVTVIEDDLLENTSCGQVIWSPGDDGLVFCALPHQHTKLGIIHCPIRKASLYYYSFDKKTLRLLSKGDNISVRAPRFSPDGSKLSYLECVAGGPHCKCLKLQLIEWPTGEPKVIIDVVNSTQRDADFQGIYKATLPARCWHPDSTHIFLSTPARSRKDIFSINIDTGEVRKQTDVAGTWCVEDVHSGYILASLSTLDSISRLVIGSLVEMGSSEAINWVYLDETNKLEDITWDVMEHTPTIPHPVYDKLTFESVILRPVNKDSKGLVVFPHGGPHAVFTCSHEVYFTFLAKLGFTVALVNYRGSIGFGEDNVNSLIGNIGDVEIKDVQQCAEEVLKKYGLDENKVVVVGGSHGGFIACHLIGQYPDFYKAAVALNPVTNLVTKIGLTDIPDWGQVECGCDCYVQCKIPSKEWYSQLFSKSPVAHIDKVKAPTMVILGELDKRVPPSQGIEFHKALQAQGVESKLLVYPHNSHRLKTIDAESDCIVSLYTWLVTHLDV